MLDTTAVSPVLRAEGVGKQVTSPAGTLTILADCSLEVGRGESLAIIGPSGSGKTTLLGLLAGLDVPTNGQIWLAGEELTALGEDGRARLRARHVGFVFQAFHLLPSLTALENVMLPLELAGDGDPIGGATRAIGAVGLEERAEHYPHKLSGGEQQRVAIARAYASRPAILFADEPTGNLDTASGERIIDLLFDLNARAGSTLVLVTHDARLAGRCSRTLELEGGRFRGQQ
ncbi:MAG TPA: ATP-binding cassette domain-containing protein [Gammaproteobacteria bacterium]|jgi:putative ABC transport system ATP-binding protein|nr:ATP-binding cassette domain-containing protein [Gammaproteobacteria bacterium]